MTDPPRDINEWTLSEFDEQFQRIQNQLPNHPEGDVADLAMTIARQMTLQPELTDNAFAAQGILMEAHHVLLHGEHMHVNEDDLRHYIIGDLERVIAANGRLMEAAEHHWSIATRILEEVRQADDPQD